MHKKAHLEKAVKAHSSGLIGKKTFLVFILEQVSSVQVN